MAVYVVVKKEIPVCAENRIPVIQHGVAQLFFILIHGTPVFNSGS
jgi:hypothetical protein